MHSTFILKGLRALKRNIIVAAYFKYIYLSFIIFIQQICLINLKGIKVNLDVLYGFHLNFNWWY